MTALEQSIVELTQANGLLTFGIDYHKPDDHDHRWFGVSLQWRDEACKYRRNGAMGSGKTIEAALADALSKLMAKRAVSLADEALPELAA